MQVSSHPLESSAPVDITTIPPDGSTLILNWGPPVSPNGEILYYVVKIMLYGSGEVVYHD